MIDLYNNYRERVEYIHALCLEEFNFSVNEDDIQFVDHGLLNFVYRVNLPEKPIYIKQALETVKEHHSLTDLLKNFSTRRIYAERNAIILLKKIFPCNIKIPEIIRYDDKNNIIVLSDVEGKNGKLLKTELKKDIFNRLTASLAGTFLGRLHCSTFKSNHIIRRSKNLDRENWKFWLELRTIKIDTDKNILSPAVNTHIYDLYHTSFNEFTSDVVLMMDCHPGNIFHRDNNEIGVIDFELASGTGDMAYDIGFLLGHYMIYALIHNCPVDALECIQKTWSSYISGIESIINQQDLVNLEDRTFRFASSVLLYRSIGGSKEKDLDAKERDLLVYKGCVLLSSLELNLYKAIDILQE